MTHRSHIAELPKFILCNDGIMRPNPAHNKPEMPVQLILNARHEEDPLAVGRAMRAREAEQDIMRELEAHHAV